MSHFQDFAELSHCPLGLEALVTLGEQMINFQYQYF